jgi:hypothetical protein
MVSIFTNSAIVFFNMAPLRSGYRVFASLEPGPFFSGKLTGRT